MLFIRLAICTLFSFTFFTLVAPEVGAQSCGTSACTGSEICLAGDGVIADAGGVEGCGLYFAGAVPVGTAALDDFGGYPAGTPVHVEGCAVPYFGFCSLTWSIRDNTIESLTPPVPALGQLGQVLTVLLVLVIGSLGVRRSRQKPLHRPAR